MYFLENEIEANLNFFLTSLKNSKWALTADERNIDSLFECALKLEQKFSQEEVNSLKKYLDTDFYLNKPVDILLESIIKNHYVDENLTNYAVKKYNLLYSKDNFSNLLDKLLSEIELRRQVFTVIEEFPDVDLNFIRLNRFICEILNNPDSQVKIQSALKCQTSVLLKAIKFSDFLSGQILMNEMILYLESQTDLRLWFKLVKNENLNTVLDLCENFNNFLCAVLKFFDMFANEIESNYDEELNVKYSHMNLDFDDFIKIFQLFLEKENIKEQILNYLGSKTLTEKNYCFWIDVKSCLELNSNNCKILTLE